MRFSEKLHKQDFIDAPFDKLDGFFKSAHLLVSGDVRFDLQFDHINRSSQTDGGEPETLLKWL